MNTAGKKASKILNSRQPFFWIAGSTGVGHK